MLNIKANHVKTALKKLLKGIIKVVIAEINDKNGTDYQLTDVYFDWKPTTLTNDTENIQNELTKANIKQVEVNTILNVAMQIGDDKALQLICEQLDVDFEEVKAAVDKAKADDDLNAAKNALNNVVDEE